MGRVISRIVFVLASAVPCSMASAATCVSMVQSATWKAIAVREPASDRDFGATLAEFEVNDATIKVRATTQQGFTEEFEAQRMPDITLPTYVYYPRRIRPSSLTGEPTSVQVIEYVEVAPSLLQGQPGAIAFINATGKRTTLVVPQ